jgi:hypothetical protein
MIPRNGGKSGQLGKLRPRQHELFGLLPMSGKGGQSHKPDKLTKNWKGFYEIEGLEARYFSTIDTAS